MTSGRLPGGVALGRLGDLALLDHLRQPGADRVAVGVQGLGHIAGGALRMVLEVVDDSRRHIGLALTRRGATGAGAAGRGPARRALRGRRVLITMTLAELRNLA